MSDIKGNATADHAVEKPHSGEGDANGVIEPEVTMASFAHLDEKKILRKVNYPNAECQAIIS
jgi:hypothetical protein